MIVAANVGVRDEVELIERNLRHLQSIGVDRIVVTDTGSTDGTAEILQAYADRGEILLMHTDPDDEGAMGFANRMLRRTLDEFLPDWVLFADGDEFHVPRTGRIHDALAATGTDVLAVERLNVALGPDGPCWPGELSPAHHAELLLIARPIENFLNHLHAHPETAWIMGRVQPKIVARASAVAAGITMGAHGAAGRPGRPPARSTDIVLAHVQASNLPRFMRKLDNIRAHFAVHGHRYSGLQAWQWRRWVQLADEGKGEQEFARQVLTAPELAAMRRELRVLSAAEWFDQAAAGSPRG
jgi:Glycosyl transferase family 2